MYVSGEAIPDVRTGYFHGESTSICAIKIYFVIVRSSSKMRMNI